MDSSGEVTMLARLQDGEYLLTASVEDMTPLEECSLTEKSKECPSTTATATMRIKVKTICEDEIPHILCVCLFECSELEMLELRYAPKGVSKFNHFKNILSERLDAAETLVEIVSVINSGEDGEKKVVICFFVRKSGNPADGFFSPMRSPQQILQRAFGENPMWPLWHPRQSLFERRLQQRGLPCQNHHG
jgi:hypothetical protein